MTPRIYQDPFFLDLFEVFRGIKRIVSDVADRHDLSMNHFVTLRVLDSCGSCTMSELTGDLNVTHGAATGTIDRLERDGFVTRTHSPSDRRVVQVSLTPAGNELMTRVYEAVCLELDGIVNSRSQQGHAAISAGLAELALAFRAQPNPAQMKDKACR